MKESKTKILILIAIVILLILIITSTYSKYQSVGVGNLRNKTAQWNLTINDTDITVNPEDLPKTFIIDKIHWNAVPTVKEGKAAPGMTGYFDVNICSKGTDVSFDYTIEVDDSNITYNGSNLSITSAREIKNKPKQKFVKVDNGPDIFSRTKAVNESKQVNSYNTDNVRFFIEWENNEANNDKDSELGLVQDNVIAIPIKFNAIQKVN